MERMNVATALNRKYLLYTGVMLHSLCVNNRRPIRAFLLHNELVEEDIQCLQNALKDFDVEIVCLKVDKDAFSERLPRNEQWSIETYYRLMLFDLLPDDVERLLYIDVDIIVNDSLEEVYQVDFEGEEIIATDDSCGKKVWAKFGDKQKEMFAPMVELGYRYFNAGFMLLNVAEMRKKYNFDYYVRAIEEWDYKMEAPDQDILNYVHWERVGYIDCWKYDLFARIAHNSGYTYEQVKKDIVIIHYAGEKPWDCDNVHFDIEQLWWDYAKMTPFYTQLLEDFLRKSMFTTKIEEHIRAIYTLVEDKSKQVQDLMDLNKKLLKIVSNNSDF